MSTIGDLLQPYGLRIEHRHEPLGLGERDPRLSWRLRSDRRGAAQAAYRITGALSQGDLDDRDRLLWDSGRVESAHFPLVEWGGAALQSATRYHWRVQVWDETGAAAGIADSWFETGLLHIDDWVATWIGHDPANTPVLEPPRDHDLTPSTHNIPPPPHLRRRFRLAGRPVRARLYASAHGVYEAFLNGQRIGDAELAPGWTEYRRRVQYQTYDVTSLLRTDENVLAAVVADGWWSGYVGLDPRRPAKLYGDAPAFLGQLVVDFADGSRQVIASDGSWEERAGAVRVADLLMGEYVDARRDIPGWDLPGSDVPGFAPVAVLDTDLSTVVTEPDEPVRVTGDVAAISVEQREPGRFVVDLGQNLVGRVRLTVRGAESGRRVQLRHAEMLADGEVYLANLRRAEATDVFTSAGAPVETFEPRFTFHGFRYVEVDNYPGQLRAEDVVGRVLHSDTPWTGTFECSDPMVNQLQSNVLWGQRGNFLSVPTDCPQRDERLGWLADAQIFAPTASRNADVAAFFSRWLLDVIDGQNSDGAFRDVAPLVALDREGAPAWGDAGVIVPWHLYRAYGDRRVLERSFDSMVAWVEHIRRHNPDLIWRNRTGNAYGDWLQIDAATPHDLLATAYFARSAELVAAAAEALGRKADTSAYAGLHAAIRESFVAAFVGADGTVSGDTQTGYLLALAFGLLPSHLTAAAVAHLAAGIEARGNRLTTGFVGVALLCPVLAEHGRADLAYALLHQDEFPSWGYSIRNGATTIWERWDGWTDHSGFQSPAMNSFNHYSLGSVGDWLYGGVAGLDQAPESVGYERLHFRPAPGGKLSWARATQETPHGHTACSWRLDAGRVLVEASVPPGSMALLDIPTTDSAGVSEADRPLADAPGVRIVGTTPAGLRVELESGSYTFSAAFPRG